MCTSGIAGDFADGAQSVAVAGRAFNALWMQRLGLTAARSSRNDWLVVLHIGLAAVKADFKAVLPQNPFSVDCRRVSRCLLKNRLYGRRSLSRQKRSRSGE